MWAWVAFYGSICNSVDHDWLSSGELAHLDMAAKLMLHGTKALAAHNCALVQPRWKTRPKLHTMWHINDDAQRGHRNPRAFWSFKEEECMGKVALIAG